MDTIALITAYLALVLASFKEGQIEFGGVLVGLFGLVLVGEYFSIKRTGKTISKNYNISKAKWGLSALLALVAISLIVHLTI